MNIRTSSLIAVLSLVFWLATFRAAGAPPEDGRPVETQGAEAPVPSTRSVLRPNIRVVDPGGRHLDDYWPPGTVYYIDNQFGPGITTDRKGVALGSTVPSSWTAGHEIAILARPPNGRDELLVPAVLLEQTPSGAFAVIVLPEPLAQLYRRHHPPVPLRALMLWLAGVLAAAIIGFFVTRALSRLLARRRRARAARRASSQKVLPAPSPEPPNEKRAA